MAEAVSQPPGARNGFLGGFMGGAFNGALMAGLFSLVHGAVYVGSMGLAAFNPLGWGVLVMAGATGLFGGIMSVRRAQEEQAATQRISRDLVREAETLAASRGVNQSMEQSAEALGMDDQNEERNWANRTARNLRASARIQSILDGGKSRAEGREEHVERLMRQREQAAFMAQNQDPQR